jgi:hypothetical protein
MDREVFNVVDLVAIEQLKAISGPSRKDVLGHLDRMMSSDEPGANDMVDRLRRQVSSVTDEEFERLTA